MFKITGLVSTGLCRAGTVLAPGSAVFTPGCTVSLSLPLYRFSARVYRVGCGLGHGLGRDNHLLARHLFFFSSFSLDFRRCWRFSDQVDNDLKSKKCFLIGIRISPGSTGVYRVDVGVTPGSAVLAPGSTVLAPGSTVLAPGSTVFTPGWRRGTDVSAPGSTVLAPGCAGLYRVHAVLAPCERRGLPC